MWNLADISMLRVSSGQDYLLCNSDLKTPVGLHLNVTAKKCFEIHIIFGTGAFNQFSHHWLPEEGLRVEVEQELQLGHDQSVKTF